MSHELVFSQRGGKDIEKPDSIPYRADRGVGDRLVDPEDKVPLVKMGI